MIDAAGINVYVIYRAMSEKLFIYRKCQLTISKELCEKGYKELFAIYVTGSLENFR
jgi:hypothetical protein